MTVVQSVHTGLLYLVDGLLYEKLCFVGSHDLERCALLLLYFYKFVALKIMDGFFKKLE